MKETTAPLYPVEIVLHPDWWNHREGIVFDEDFFFHAGKRVEEERRMERALYERWGEFGLGEDRNTALPEVGAVHLAAGFLLSGMLGCRVEYAENSAPRVIPANRDDLDLRGEDAFSSPYYKKFAVLLDRLKSSHGYLRGDVNWGGVLNIALDLRGEKLFMDMYDRPEEVRTFFTAIGEVLDRFTRDLAAETGTTSISVNRITRLFPEPIFLHSECSHTMISEDLYKTFLFDFDRAWSLCRRPFGIHYCGQDPHRYGDIFAALPRLDFLDVGWGGDVAALRARLPETFFSIRLSPVEIARMTPSEIEGTLRKLAAASGRPELTGFCCVNMDKNVKDENITAIFRAAGALRKSVRKSA